MSLEQWLGLFLPSLSRQQDQQLAINGKATTNRGQPTKVIDVEDTAHSATGSPVLGLDIAGRCWGVINGGVDLGQRGGFLHFGGHIGCWIGVKGIGGSC